MEKLLDRINALARKKKSEGLTEDELKEQQELRKKYLKNFRSNFRAQIENISIVDENGNETPVRSKKQMMDVSTFLPNLKPESEYTEEEKQHVAELSQSLATELGNPAKPTGEAGIQMLHRMNESHAALTDWAFSFFSYEPGEAILDIGCGGGAALKKIADLAPESTMIGIDYSEISVEESKKNNQDLIDNQRLMILNATVSDMPFNDNGFDKIYSIESYYFWPKLEEDLQEIYRVLKPGGKVLIAAECYTHLNMPQKTFDDIKKYNLNYCLSENEFKTYLSEAGFSSVDVYLKDGTEWIVAIAAK